MSKIKLPPAVLNGTPLTENEMKEILGGMQDYTLCSCTLYYDNGNVTDRHLSISSGATKCAEACKELCSATENFPPSVPKCIDSRYTYTVGN